MTLFNDGAAKGQTLMLKRAPHFLRVVQDKRGQCDALDRIEDTPKTEETLFVYVIDGVPGTIHINAKKTGGFYTLATYHLLPEQPEDSIMRDTAKWQAWCRDAAKPVTTPTP